MKPSSEPPLRDVLVRHICVGDDGARLIVLECRYALHLETTKGTRAYPGARFWVLETGEVVRVLDRQTFEVLPTGEHLTLIEG